MTVRWAPLGVAMIGAALGAFFGVSALTRGPGREVAPVAKAAPPNPLATYTPAAPHVLASITVYPIGPQFQKPGPDPPLGASMFDKPVASYRRYALEQLRLLDRKGVA